MASELLPSKVEKASAGKRAERLPGVRGLRLVDTVLVLAFLALTFLLGAFPLKDTDFWWHLKAGDGIRETGVIPTTDTYTFTAEGKPWIDLHWLFQVAISWVYAHGGVPMLTLAKCAVTTLAVALLVSAKRREWPIWAMLLAWLPALLVLSGRMYVRPETLTLLYLAGYLAVLSRIDRWPALAFLLPLIQVAWVNTQGLFVLGPIVFGFALIDALLRPASLSKGRARWWKIVLGAGGLAGLACLVNPYGLSGALYPLQLAGTMSNPVFSNSIAELMPIPMFIERDGFVSLPFRLQILTLALGAASFVLPLIWLVVDRLRSPKGEPAEAPAKSQKTSKRAARAKSKKVEVLAPATLWRLSPFRFLLFLAFSVLSWRATRNSHQFAAVVGTLTAWNFGEWAYAIHRRRLETSPASDTPTRAIMPRLLSLGAIVGVLIWVASGSFYAASREGRVIGLGEEPFWYPKEAIKFAGTEGMPDRFVAFHVGHPSLYEYYHAPERKVFVDARLEVMGPELYERYVNLQSRITQNDPSWTRELEELGRPAVLADHENASVTSALLANPDWKCVWFDPIAALFVHKSYTSIVEKYAIDFGARHFKPVPSEEPSGTDALRASAKGIRSIASTLSRFGPIKTRPLILLGLDQARRLAKADPESVDPWKLIGQLEMLREATSAEPVPRFRSPFDPVFDLSAVRETYALKRAIERADDDYLVLFLLSATYQSRLMNEAALPLLDRLTELTPINAHQRKGVADAAAQRDALLSALGPLQDPPAWRNLKEQSEIVNGLLSHGRAETAAIYLEKATAPESRSWDEADRIASLWLHLGGPARARTTWAWVANPPRPGLKASRIAVTYLVEGDFEKAREKYQAAIAVDPELFEAQYGLAILEQDAGRAAEALQAGRAAVKTAPNDVARMAAQTLVAFVTPYATPPIAREP